VESVLLFGNGYLANVGILQALASKGDAIFQDRLNHASLLDGGLSSGARHQRYHHADVADLERRLRADTSRRRLVVSDGVFSMDGDIAPVPELLDVAKAQDALLVLDEAHAFGVLGEQGRGTVSHANLPADAVPLRIGTLGKAFGVYCAFAAGPKLLLDVLQQTTRTAIYTTALPPALAETTRHALRKVRADEWRRQRLREHTTRLREGLLAQGWSLMPSLTPIQPIHIGTSARAVALSAALAERGFWVGAIRPPTVPVGTARLRLTLTASHDDAALTALLNTMAELAPEFAHERTT
jgi:8-amino-7-oxononanoate synthase